MDYEVLTKNLGIKLEEAYRLKDLENIEFKFNKELGLYWKNNCTFWNLDDTIINSEITRAELLGRIIQNSDDILPARFFPKKDDKFFFWEFKAKGKLDGMRFEYYNPSDLIHKMLVKSGNSFKSEKMAEFFRKNGGTFDDLD